jgi:selenocysteine-specific elongation factor
MGQGELFLAREVVAVSDQPFILREESPAATLGGGLVARPTGRRTRRRDRPGISRLARRASPEPDVRLLAALEDQGAAIGLPLDLCRETGIPLDRLADRLAALAEAGQIAEVVAPGRRLLGMARGVLEEAEGRVARSLARLHERWPRQSAIRRIHLAASLPDLADSGLADALIDRLIARGDLVGDGSTVALASFEPRLSHSERKLKAEILEAIRGGGFSPPDVPDLTPRGGARPALVPELLTLLADEGRIVAISATLYLSDEAESDLCTRVRDRLKGDATMTMSDLRDLLGTTRKYAVPIGEYLDRIGLTHREGDVRRLGEPSGG